MSFYGKYVLPRVLDVCMRNRDTAQLRAELIPRARGVVLEVGIGSGLNLPFYSADVSRIYGVDPSPEMLKMARKRAEATAVPVELFPQSAEEPLPLADQSIDTAAVAWSLCSIPDPLRALQQVRRVLRSGGQLLFVEHGLAPDGGVKAWQDRLNPIWRRIGGGCNLNRPIDELIRSAGFEITDLKAAYMPGPRFLTYTYQGVAR
jgi:ubiquinone/menaquinone biosynthesis C-methylase UbiE